MPYNSIIDRTDAGALIPMEYSAEIIKSLPNRSAVMRLGRRLPNMSVNQKRLPVMSAMATAYFVSGDISQKQTSEVNWASKYIDAEELAVIVPIPEAVIDDSSFDIWSEVRPSLEEAFGKAIDAAVVHGTNIPSTWTTNLGAAGLLAGAVAASQTVDYSTQVAAGQDVFDMVMGESGLFNLVEADGFAVNGSIAAMVMKSRLRGLRGKVYNGSTMIAAGEPIFAPSMQEANRYLLDGTPIEFPLNGSINSSTLLQLSGDWSQLVYSMRQDITYKVLTEAVIQDGAGNIVYNLAQQDMVALRAVMRLGFALPNPVTALQPTAASRYPFAALVP